MRLISTILLTLPLTLGLACGDDAGGGDTGTPSDTGTGGDSAIDTGTDNVCMEGCVQTLAAMCMNGPATMEECVNICNILRTGDCASEYGAFIACGEGMGLTCNDAGIPFIAACEAEQTAFLACL